MMNDTEQLGSLVSFGSRNWFASDTNHEAHALRLRALEAALSIIASWNTLIDRAKVYGENYPELARFRGAETTPAFVAAAKAQRLIAQARDRMNAAGDQVPTQPPPTSVSLSQWRLSWYIDLGQLEKVLPELNDGINRGSAAYAALAQWVSNRAGRTQTIQAPQLPTNVQIDKSPLGVQDLPQPIREIGSNVVGVLKSPLGLYAMMAVAVFLWLRRRA